LTHLLGIIEGLSEKNFIDKQLWQSERIFMPTFLYEDYCNVQEWRAKRRLAKAGERDKAKDVAVLSHATEQRLSCDASLQGQGQGQGQGQVRNNNPLPPRSDQGDKEKIPPVATLAAALPPKGVCKQKAKVVLEFGSIRVPDHLQTPEFLEAWQERIEWASSRPKSSRPVLSSQIKELAPYSATEATMLVRRAMSWQGLGLDSYRPRKESNIPGMTTNSKFEDIITRHRAQDSIRVARYENIYGREARERGQDGRAPKGWLAENLELNTFG
jgi:hypothetical protein